MRSNLIQFEIRIIGLLRRDQICYLTPWCVDINQEDLAFNVNVEKWMIQFQISQKNVHIVELKVIIEAIIRTDKLDNKIQFQLWLLISSFSLPMYLCLHFLIQLNLN